MSRRGGATEAIPRAEWAVAVASALLVLGTIGFLAARAVGTSAPPDLVAAVDTVTARPGGGWAVRVRVENRGDLAAAGVEVEGRVGSGGEVHAFTVPFIAGHATRHGALLFDADPRAGALALRIRGYADP